MENYEEFKSRRLEELAKLPMHESYTPVDGLYIPLGIYLAIKEIDQSDYQTAGGVYIPGAKKLEQCKLGVVYAMGEECKTPIKLGDMVAFDKFCNFGINYKGVEYLRVRLDEIFFIVPPENYLDPHYADFFEKRRESRIAGEKIVRKREDNKLEESFEKRDEQNRKKDYIEGKPSDSKTIIK
jgi:co-chaperonin GroES (HSP10)